VPLAHVVDERGVVDLDVRRLELLKDGVALELGNLIHHLHELPVRQQGAMPEANEEATTQQDSGEAQRKCEKAES
jgi:hypothetical protein